MAATSHHPLPSPSLLNAHYVGKSLTAADIPLPAAVLDLAVLKKNCAAMLRTVKELGVGFRAHVKTHKASASLSIVQGYTTELTRLQVGEDTKDVRIIVSTVVEAEQLLPYLQECLEEGKSVNVLYGVPVAPSNIRRLASLAELLGDDTISFMIDHPSQLTALRTFPRKFSLFVKIDTGYGRAGVRASSETGKQIMAKIRDLAETCPLKLVGFYSHLGSSYSVSSPSEAITSLIQGLEGTAEAALEMIEYLAGSGSYPESITLSIGATPTATAAQNLHGDLPEVARARDVIERLKESFHIELHAGNYPVLDMQQLATHARASQASNDTSLSTENIAMRVLVEVASVYSEREKPEALVTAGSLALGREPCKSYPGWGVITSWSGIQGDVTDTDSQVYDEEQKTGWIVGRISQEHGILSWEGPQENTRTLEVGERLLIWPNHACIAAAGFDWYLIVNSDLPPDKRDEVVDVWVRWHRW